MSSWRGARGLASTGVAGPRAHHHIGRALPSTAPRADHHERGERAGGAGGAERRRRAAAAAAAPRQRGGAHPPGGQPGGGGRRRRGPRLHAVRVRQRCGRVGARAMNGGRQQPPFTAWHNMLVCLRPPRCLCCRAGPPRPRSRRARRPGPGPRALAGAGGAGPGPGGAGPAARGRARVRVAPAGLGTHRKVRHGEGVRGRGWSAWTTHSVGWDCERAERAAAWRVPRARFAAAVSMLAATACASWRHACGGARRRA